MRNITLEGKIVIFKTIAMSKIVSYIYNNCPKAYEWTWKKKKTFCVEKLYS